MKGINLKSIKREIIFIILMSIIGNVLVAQTTTTNEQLKVPIGFAGTTQANVPKETTYYGNKYKVSNASVEFVFSINDDQSYGYGSSSENLPFEYNVQFDILAYSSSDVEISVFTESSISLTIKNEEPMTVFYKDITSSFENHFDYIIISNVVLVETTEPSSDFSDNLSFSLNYNINYAYDVMYNDDEFIEEPINSNFDEENSVFSWEHAYPFSLYQFQILKLYNINSAKNDEVEIVAEMDWSKALTFEVPIKEIFNQYGQIKIEKETKLTISQGSGFYVWRVRPIGSYYINGVANKLNWGPWSYSNAEQVSLVRSSLDEPFFYFEDSEEDKNWIYSRVITEENKSKEIKSFANGLNHEKQKQVYLNSDDVTQIVQTVYDYSGRPALVTMPVPVDGKVEEYKEKFVTTGNELYTAKNFDADGSNGVAEPVDETNDFSYYKNNIDQRIPNAEGYPFSRVMYYDDGLNRLREESGLGPMHKITEDGSGKTVKYYYSTPSESEIVRLFGNEAPDHQSISKIVKVDQNNIATISYNTMDGKVLATCLAFYDGDNLNLENVDGARLSEDKISISDKITNNYFMSNAFTSSKRLVFLEPTELNIGYQIKVNQLKAQCQTLTLDCKYRLFMYLHKVETGERIPIYEDIDLSSAPTVEIGGEEFIVLNPVTFMETEIQTGTYIVEKKIIPGDPSVSLSNSEKDLQDQIAPIAKLISEWLKSIECEEMVQPYYNSMRRLADAINSWTFDTFDNTDPDDPNNTDHESFPVYEDIVGEFINFTYQRKTPKVMKELYEMYLLSEADDNSFYETPEGQNPEYILLNSGCCEILLNIKWVPTFDFSAEPELFDYDGDGPEVYNYYDIYNGSVNAEFIPDFEGYALAYLQDCAELSGEFDKNIENDESFYRYMEGWNYPGTFNMMIHNMLTDLYKCENPYIEARKQQEDKEYVNPYKNMLDACGNPVVDDCNDGECPQYTTRELFECWQAVLINLKQSFCSEDFSEYPQEGTNVSSSIDDENEGDKGVHDNHFDDNISGGGFITRWLAKRKMSKKMRGLNSDPDITSKTVYKQHLVEEFLNCTGYKFAKILSTYDAIPLGDEAYNSTDAARNGNFEYVSKTLNDKNKPFPLEMNELNKTLEEYIKNYRRDQSGNFQYPYIPLKNWGPMKEVPVDEESDEVKYVKMFPFIRNPIYAFKYFEYENEGMFPKLERDNNFDDPNDCFAIDEATGFIQLDQNNQPIRVPCCGEDLNDPFCYPDPDYPNLADLPDNGCGIKTIDINGQQTKVKYIVNDFAGFGRVKTPYTKYSWSCGQRYTFYLALKGHTEPGPKWQQLAEERNCNFYETPQEWWINPDLDGYDDLVTEDEKDQIETNNPGVILDKWDASNFDRYTDIVDPEGTYSYDPVDAISFVEYEIVRLLENCHSGCENKRSQLKMDIREMLLDKCYTIGECYDGTDLSIVPEGDIEIMADRLIEICKEQCELNTYSCHEFKSRHMNTKKSEVGYSHIEFRLDYGIAGHSTGTIDNCSGSSYVLDDEAYNTGVEIYLDTDANPDLFKYNSRDTYGYPYPVSWYQYTKLLQATEWNMVVELPSKCPENEGERDVEGCNEGWFDEAGSENYDTYMQREGYEVNDNTPTDMYDVRINDPVKSPAKKVIINIENN